MPDIPAMAIPVGSTEIDSADIYEQGGFDPLNPPDTLEILNGGLDSQNWDSGEVIPTWAFQIGAFARAFYVPFDRWEFIYAKQLANDATKRVRLPPLCAEFFLPWDATAVIFGFQAFCRQDATVWDDAAALGGPYPEYWTLETRLDGTQITGLDTSLFAGRDSADWPVTAAPVDDPGVHSEVRWPWVSKSHIATTLTKGNHSVRVSAWMKCYNPDPKTAKLAVPTGGLWVVALR